MLFAAAGSRQLENAATSFTTAWSQDIDDRAAVRETVERWRRGVRNAA